MAYTKNIYEIFAKIATEIGCNYLMGSFKEVQKRLMEQSKDVRQRDIKYPLLILTTPIPQQFGTNSKYEAIATVNLTLVTETQQIYTVQERLENVYKPVLYPLYNSLMGQITNMVYFDTNNIDELEFNYTDFFYYSGDEVYTQNKLAAILDAITIENLELKILKQTCINE